jgi:hypothetical protein
MIEERLPEAVRASATVHLGEYAWRVPAVFDAIEAAAGLKLAVVLGDPRIRLPQGVYEFEAPTAEDEEEMRRPEESWRAFVERAAEEARRSLRRLNEDRTWISGEEFAPADLGDLEWVLYFIEEG